MCVCKQPERLSYNLSIPYTMLSDVNVTLIHAPCVPPASDNGIKRDRLTACLNAALSYNTSLTVEAKLRCALRTAK